MIVIGNDDVGVNHSLYVSAYASAANASFLQDGFVAKAFPALEKLANRTYPYEVKLPKSMDAMLRGDFEPARIIKVEKPFSGPNSNIWFGDSSSGISLRGGYKNGDSRYICDQVLGDDDIHMILAGATGQGKSVTLNALIYGLCLEYAPWEISLTLCDAKIVEFKSYAMQTPMPHIRSIAATGDVDYLISVLKDLEAEMIRTNSLFTVAGVKNIKDFRKKTGLCLPQNLIVIDEFQTMFKNAGKKLVMLTACIDAFARLGRNTGYHLLLASQELGTDIPKGTLASIKARAAMGCTSAISEMILGNDEAKNNYGKKGRLLINTNADSGNPADNALIRVPYMPDPMRISMGEFLIKKAKEVGFKRTMMFYDEEAKMYESQYVDFLKKFEIKKDRILLGEPSFVLNDEEQVVKLKLDGKEMENICVLVNNNTHLQRYFKMLKANIMLQGSQVQNLVCCVDSMFEDECAASELTSANLYNDSKSFLGNSTLEVAFSLINRRKLCLAVDKLVFTNAPYNDAALAAFHDKIEVGSVLDTDVNRRRFYFAFNLLHNEDEFFQAFGLNNITNKETLSEREYQIAYRIVDMFDMYGCSTKRISYEDFTPIYVWILGMAKMLGLGRDYKPKNIAALKKALLDCTDVNIRFMLFSTTLEDMRELVIGIRWAILDDTPVKEQTSLKASDDYPPLKTAVLGILFDSLASTDRCVKFKKMILDGETVA